MPTGSPPGVSLRIKLGEIDPTGEFHTTEDPSIIEGELAAEEPDHLEDEGDPEPEPGESAPEVTDDPATWPIMDAPPPDEWVQQMHMPCPRCRISALPGLSPVVNPALGMAAFVFNCLRCGMILAPLGVVPLQQQRPAGSQIAVPSMTPGRPPIPRH